MLSKTLIPLALCLTAAFAGAADPVRLTLRESAGVSGVVTVRDVARVEGDVDASILSRVVRVDDGGVDLQDVIRVLGDAGIRGDQLLVNGPARCVITRIAPETGENAIVSDEWGDLVSSSNAHASPTGVIASESTKQLMLEQIAEALALPIDTIKVRSRDDLPAGVTKATATQPPTLGSSTWRLTLADGSTKSVRIEATATVIRARVARPIGRGSVIRPEDLEKSAAVVDTVDDIGLSLAAAVGQRAARTLTVGDALVGRDLAAPMLVKRGQLVTVTLNRGGVIVRTLAKASGDATFGQVVKCRAEATGEDLSVVVTGPQAGSVAS